VTTEEQRIEAEQGRVAAEEQRVAAARLSYAKVAALVALPIALVALIPSTVGIYLLDREIHSRCVDGQINRDAIRGSLTRSLANIGYRYDADTNTVVVADKPPLHYYLEHPNERDRQLALVRESLDSFPPISC
jgi:hypothetical protein